MSENPIDKHVQEFRLRRRKFQKKACFAGIVSGVFLLLGAVSALHSLPIVTVGLPCLAGAIWGCIACSNWSLARHAATSEKLLILWNIRLSQVPPAVFPVTCMDCNGVTRFSEVAGSTGLCDLCLEQRDPKPFPAHKTLQ